MDGFEIYSIALIPIRKAVRKCISHKEGVEVLR
jgi:hypothetical protein